MGNAPQANPWVDAIHAYVPGRDSVDADNPPVKLSSNENPLGPSPKAVAAMEAAAGGMHRYPDGGSHKLRIAIAGHHGLEAERIICGTGSDEILQLLALAYAGPGDEVLYVEHGFMVYPLAAQRVGATPVAAPDLDYTADIDALIDAVSPATRLVYIANPNNPTGTMVGRNAIERLHAALPAEVLLVLDSAYAEYVTDEHYEDGIALARKHPNVIMTRTFSKLYGLAGERVGWAYGPRAVIETLNRIRGPFNVTRAGQAGAIQSLADREWTRHCRDENARTRTVFEGEIGKLANHGLRAVPSEANFVLVLFPETGPLSAEAAYQYLAARNILTRWLPGQGLAHALRISIGTEAETRAAADAIADFTRRNADDGDV